MVLLEYEYRDTPWHRMQPITKAIFLFSINTLVIMIMDWRWKLPIFIMMLVLMYTAKLPKVWWQLLTAGFILSQLVTRLPWTIFYVNPEFFKTLPLEFTTRLIFEITPEGTPLVGRTAVTWGTVYYALCFMFNQPILLISTFIFVYTTSPSDLLHSLYKVKVPDPIIFTFVSAWRFFPLFIRNFYHVWDAQRLRGWSMETRNPVTAAKKLFPVVYPVSRLVPPLYDDLTLSVKARAFGAQKVDPKPMPLSMLDYSVIIFCFLAVGVVIYGVYTWYWGII